MLITNLLLTVLALVFAFRGYRLFFVARQSGHTKESIIAFAIGLMYTLVLARTFLLIEVGASKIADAGLLLNYYLYIGTVIINTLISDFVIAFLYDKTTRTGS